MLLRVTSVEDYEVVGTCFVHGLMDNEAFLGPIPAPWEIQYLRRSWGIMPCFLNSQTNSRTLNDPRLPLVPPMWVETENQRTADDNYSFQSFRNIETGEVINYDPRMSPIALRGRGVELEAFRLV